MINKPEIRLLAGFGRLDFGVTPDLVKQVFGEPDEIQNLNDEILENNSLVFHYWSLGCSLFFDLNKNSRLCSIETDNKASQLFDASLFSLKEKDLILLMKENGYELSDSEVHSWGEKRLSFDAAVLDCYFENHRLVSVNFGLPETEPMITFFPN